MKKEKHEWENVEEYINIFGDVNNHYVMKYKQCVKCGIKMKR